MAWVLCTKSDVISLHPIQEQELYDEWSDFVEGLIREHLGLPQLGASLVVADEHHNGDGTNLLFVSQPPILLVASLLVNGIALSASDYVVFDNYIELRAQAFPRGVLNVRVSYTSGTEEVSSTVRLTAAAMVVALIIYRRRHGADGSLKWGSTDSKVGEKSQNTEIGLADHLKAIMVRFLKRPRVKVH